MSLALTNRRKARLNGRRKAKVAKARKAKRNVSALMNRRRRMHRKPKMHRRARRNVSALMNPKRRHRKAKRNVSALMNRRRHHRKAKHNRRRAHRNPVSALMNRRHRKSRRNVSALMNPKRRRHHRKARRNPVSALMNPGMKGLKGVKGFVMMAMPWTVGGVAAFAAHTAAEQYGLTGKIEEYSMKIPYAGPYVAAASHTVQGAAVAALLGMAAKMIGGKAAPYLQKTAISAVVIGAAQDAQRAWESKQATGQWLPMGDLAFGSQYGDLAFGQEYGDLAFGQQYAGLSYGDGMAWETAPLTADYAQASLGDAYHSGADFSAEEGQCLVNGRGHYLERYGAPPHRMQMAPKGASHLAGREGHRWGWLIKMVGWEKARQIAAMPPEKRIKALHKIRAAALQAFQAEMAQHAATDAAREIPEQHPDFLAQTAGGAQGAQGAASTNGYGYGDGALFMGA